VDRIRDKGCLWTGYRTRGTWGQDSEQGILVDRMQDKEHCWTRYRTRDVYRLVERIKDKGNILVDRI
jgi:hypothetical protein